jgi:hypothetical protein
VVGLIQDLQWQYTVHMYINKWLNTCTYLCPLKKTTYYHTYEMTTWTVQ